MADRAKGSGDYFVNLLIHGFFRLVLLLPYKIRVPFAGWFMARLVAPLAGYTGRIRANLAYTCPELTKPQVARLCYEVPNNVGRSLIEIYSGDHFISRVRDTPLSGPGAEALQKAHSTKRPVVLVTGHFGNYDAPRAALIARGYNVGAIYMPMKNAFFNEHYEVAISNIGEPLFARGRRGLGQMLKFLRAGGMTGFLVDQYMKHGAPLQFFGKTAPTALSAAELALKYDALLVPIYGIRADNGLDFTIQVDAPIEHTDAKTMTQALNDSLEQLVRQHMGQWFWIHRRWKPERQARHQRKRAAAKIGPGPTA
ncbi:MAG: lysophospholipid acyltransferase family protein [Marinosulfonomonas sp.]|nr:lysophospholipid acyltransferase family protein [Marinosulfonomonas sp.]